MFPAPSHRVDRRRLLISVLLTAFCATIAVSFELFRPAFYVRAEYQLRDLVTRAGRTAPANPDLLFLAIDSDSVHLEKDLDITGLFASAKTDPNCQRALEIMTSGWPWNREIYSLILDRLIGAGAKVVAFDCLFPAPAPGDDAFRAALERYRSKVVVGSNFVTPQDVDLTRRIPSSYESPAETLLPRTWPPDERAGFTNFFAGENNIVRAAQFRVAFRDRDQLSATYLSLSARAVAAAGHVDLVPQDLGESLIRFTGPRDVVFRPHPIFEIFVPEYWEHNYRSGQLLRDKIVVVGATGKWQKDEVETPFGTMPGAQVHLNAINAILRRDFLKELPAAGNVGIIVFAGLIGALFSLGIRSPWIRFGALGAINLVAPFVALGSYNYAALYLPCVTPFLALNATVLLCLVSDFAFERMEEVRLRSTLKTRDDLTHMIVHDLRSPLTIVKGYVDALAQMDQRNPREAKFIAEAQRGADKMRDMITTLLDVGRLEAGQMPLRLESRDVSEIARTAASRFTPVLGNRTVDCHLPDEPVMVQCDADVIRRVVENLVSNAIKFTRSDGRIVVAVSRSNALVAISVTDDGEGIPVTEQKNIFEKFGQTSAGAEKKHSTGIGLAFCRMAVEVHGGAIKVESELGRGTTFTFTLPIQSEPKIDKHTLTSAQA